MFQTHLWCCCTQTRRHSHIRSGGVDNEVSFYRHRPALKHLGALYEREYRRYRDRIVGSVSRNVTRLNDQARRRTNCLTSRVSLAGPSNSVILTM